MKGGRTVTRSVVRNVAQLEEDSVIPHTGKDVIATRVNRQHYEDVRNAKSADSYRHCATVRRECVREERGIFQRSLADTRRRLRGEAIVSLRTIYFRRKIRRTTRFSITARPA